MCLSFIAFLTGAFYARGNLRLLGPHTTVAHIDSGFFAAQAFILEIGLNCGRA